MATVTKEYNYLDVEFREFMDEIIPQHDLSVTLYQIDIREDHGVGSYNMIIHIEVDGKLVKLRRHTDDIDLFDESNERIRNEIILNEMFGNLSVRKKFIEKYNEVLMDKQRRLSKFQQRRR